MGSVLKAGIQNRVRLTDKYATGMVCARPEFATFSFESYGKEYRFRLFEPALCFTNEIPALILRLGYAKRKMPYSPRKSWRERLVP